MQTESTTKTEAVGKTNFNQSTVIISEENKSLFTFRKNQLLEQGFQMVGQVKEETKSSFWDFFSGAEKTTYTATFEKR